ncbi:MAG: response regulator [Chloroflexi bacterium]|nr:response regulator [Chloroflexota bacterium]
MAHILVVDDEPEITRMVTKIMESRGHRITVATDGQEALAAIAREVPDVVILDLHLPKIDGFEVCRRLKANPSTTNIPIVMLTAAYPGIEDANRGLELGADEYVVKPFLSEVLVHNVERLLPEANCS